MQSSKGNFYVSFSSLNGCIKKKNVGKQDRTSLTESCSQAPSPRYFTAGDYVLTLLRPVSGHPEDALGHD